MKAGKLDLKRPPMLPFRQHEFMCANKFVGFRYPSTIRALFRQDLMIECDNFRTFTKKGRDYVRAHKDYQFQHFLGSYLHRDMLVLKNGSDKEGAGIPVVHDDDTLKGLLLPDGMRPIPPVVVDQSGDFPPRVTVKYGPRHAPIAYLHPFYHWQIEREKTAGQFLERTDYLINDMAYQYEPSAREAIPVLGI